MSLPVLLNSTSLKSAIIPDCGVGACLVIVTESEAAAPFTFVPLTVITFAPTSSMKPSVQSTAALNIPEPPVSEFVQLRCPMTLVLQMPSIV